MSRSTHSTIELPNELIYKMFLAKLITWDVQDDWTGWVTTPLGEQVVLGYLERLRDEEVA